MTSEQRRWAAARPVHLTIVSTSRPRRCGIASYTADVVSSLEAVAPNWHIDVCALDRDGMKYDDRVSVVIAEAVRADYREAADELLDRGTELVLIQHEYGIFGGADGSYLLDFTDRLVEIGLPYVVTLHTVLSHPSSGQDTVLLRMCQGAALVTVFTPTARQLVIDAGVIDGARVVVAEHGAPEVLRAPSAGLGVGPAVTETLRDISGSIILCTFGLISPGKGLEVALASLPALVAKHPRLIYLIAGATHPEVARTSGERYRDSLAALSRELGVQEHVRFLDAFLSDAELARLLARTDVYVTPYLSTEQSSSGTLTFALAAGCPVVSTDYQYALNLLAAPEGGDAPGLLVPAGDAVALTGALSRLLDDPALLERTRRAADARGSTLTWPAVAELLARTLAPLAPSRRSQRARAHPLVVDHLERLVERGGMLQFSQRDTPDHSSGYCVDDVARLAIVAAALCERRGRAGADARDWLAVSLKFLEEAVGEHGMHNLRSRGGTWQDNPHLGDHVGRTIWGLGAVTASRAPGPMRRRAEILLESLLPLASDTPHLRSSAYAALGLARVSAHPTRQTITRESEKIVALRAVAATLDAALASGTADWPWFENQLRYDNARLPQALLVAGSALGDAPMVQRALDALDWYLAQVALTGENPVLHTVGNLWRSPGDGDAESPNDPDAEGDEQPLDAAAVVEALVDAWRVTRSPRYARLARQSFGWFDGRNRSGIRLYDPHSGGVFDGLHSDHANANMGAESTLAYYQALFALVDAGLIALSEWPGRQLSDRRSRQRRIRGIDADTRVPSTLDSDEDVAQPDVVPAATPATIRRTAGT